MDMQEMQKILTDKQFRDLMNYERYRQNRVDALMAAATWLSGPTGGQVADDVVNSARVFERFLNED